MRIILTAFFALILLVNTVHAAQYYVDVNGNDSWNGNVSNGDFLPTGCEDDGDTCDCTDGPWKTIQHAADTIEAGDKVIVKDGVYNEFVEVRTSGSPSKPITFEGERGTTGEWLTIIDPSTPIERGWKPAPEIGAGVYKQDLGFEPFEMMVDYKTISRITNENMNDGTGVMYLALASDADYPNDAPQTVGWGTVKWWDGLEAMYGYKGSNGLTYIRFRDDDDPNTKSIRATPNGGVPISPKKPGVKLLSVDHVIFKGFRIRGAYYGLAILHGSNNIVERNYITNGFAGVGIESSDSEHNIIRNNEITYNYYGYDNPGSWQNGAKDEYKYGVKESLYRRHKFLFRMPQRIRIGAAGDHNELYQNNIFGSIMGVMIYGGTPTKYTKFHNNTVYGISGFGIIIMDGQSETEYYDNLVYDCNVNLRWHHFNKEGEKERTVYIYRNKFCQPEGVGKHIHIHWYATGGDYKPTFWLYHNSFSGGAYVIYNARHNEAQTLPNVYIVNNVGSSRQFFLYCQHNASSFYSDGNALGALDYNWVGKGCSVQDAVWFGKHNIVSDVFMWDGDEIPDYVIPRNRGARDGGIDLSRKFVLRDKTFDPLPGLGPAYYSGIAPESGAVESPPDLSAPSNFRMEILNGCSKD
jgi:hypothetical protein